MKAIVMHSYGGPEVLSYEGAPVPEIAPDEVLIKIHAAAVNPIDWKFRQGHLQERMKVIFPFIPGWDLAGTIEETGALVTRFKKGDKVFSRSDTSRNGSYAEYIAVRAPEVAFAPANISLNHAAGVPLAAQTAWAGLFEVGNLKSGQCILIHGGAGGVGNFAIQLAKCAGAYVVTTASGSNTDLVQSLGADTIIDHKTEDFSKKIKEADFVFDTIGGETQVRSLTVLRKGGILVSTLGVEEKVAADENITAKNFMVNSNGARLQEISGLIEAGKVQVIIGKEFPLRDARQAHELSEAGHAKGKIILNVI